MEFIDVSIIVIYLLGMLFIGIMSNKNQKTMEDFFLGSKDLNTFSIMSLWLSSWVGGAAIVGTADNAYNMGITAFWYVGAVCIGFAIFGLFFTGLIKDAGDKFDHITYPDLIEDRYDSKCRGITVISTVLANIAYNAGQLVAAGGIISTFLGWSLDTSIIVSSIVVTIYTASGGLTAVTYTDILQTILIVVSLVFAIPTVLKLSGGSIGALRTQLPSSYFKLGSWGFWTILGLVLSIILTFFTSMDSYTRSFAAKDAKTARNGTLLAIIGTGGIAFAVTYIGIAGKAIFPNLSEGTSILSILIIEVLPKGIKGLMLIGLMSAIMSTSDISILSASANITRDIYHRYIDKDAEDKKLLKISTISAVGIGILSTIMALRMLNIIDILYVAFTINSAGLFLPTITMFFWEKANSRAAFYSMLASLVTVLIWFFADLFGLGGIFGIDPVWPGLITSFIIFIPLCLILEQTDEEKLKAKKYLVKN